MVRASNIVALVAPRAAMAGSTLFILVTGVTHAQVYIADGSLESRTLGTAPDVGTPNGAWQFPQNYVTAGVAETLASEFSVTSDPVGGVAGKKLFHRNTFGPTWTGNRHLAGLFETPYVRSLPRRVSTFRFDVYFPSAGAGGAIYLGTGFDTSSRGPQLSFIDDAGSRAPMSIYSTNQTGQLSLLGTVPRNQWTTFEITADLYDREFDLRVAQRGLPLAPLASNLQFRGGVSGFDRIGLAAFSGQSTTGAYQAYFDNFDFQVIPSPGPLSLMALATVAGTRRRRS